MGALVLLRDLAKSSALGQTIVLDVLFRRLNFDNFFEFVISRATSPFSSEAVARKLHFLGIRTATESAHSSPDLDECTRRYDKRLLTSLRVDVIPSRPDPFLREMGNVYTLLDRSMDPNSHRPRVSRSTVPPNLNP